MIKTKSLLAKLEKVLPGLASTEILEQSQSFLFIEDGIATYNDEILIMLPYQSPIKGAVPSAPLMGLLNKTTEEEFEIETSKNEIVFAGQKAKAGITLDLDIKNPVLETLKSLRSRHKWNPLPKDFIEVCSFVLDSCSSNMSTPILTCVHITPEYAESCDNIRATRYTFESAASKKLNCCIPSSVIRLLSRYQFDEIDLGTDGWVCLKEAKSGLMLACRTFKEAFPDLAPIFSITGDILKFPVEVEQAVQAAEVFNSAAFDTDRSVAISVAGDKMKIKGQDACGWYRQTITLKKPMSKEIAFSVHPALFSNVIKKSKKAEVDDCKICFKTDRLVHVILQVK